jgi:hypothetical protein
VKVALSAFFALLLYIVPRPAVAAPIVIDFESLDDSVFVGGSILGLTFSNATVLTAGISLNEFDLPPNSGSNVIFDDGGGIRIDFASPVFSVGGYFNYYAPVTLRAFDAANNLLESVSTLFSINAVGLGDPGSLSNELLQLTVGGAAYLTLTGDSLGGSFTLDDFRYDSEAPTGPAPIPEPATLLLFATGAATAVMKVKLTSRRLRCG